MQAAVNEKTAKDKMAAELAAKAKAAADAKAAAEKRAAELAKAAEQKNVNVFESSTSTLLRITPAPAKLNVTAPATPLAPGAQVEIPVAVARMYGLADALEIELVVPESAKGLSAAKLTLPADQAEGKLVLAAAADATPGKHVLVARSKFKFGGADFQVDQPVTVEVTAAK